MADEGYLIKRKSNEKQAGLLTTAAANPHPVNLQTVMMINPLSDNQR
jgi:hypothetical protein